MHPSLPRSARRRDCLFGARSSNSATPTNLHSNLGSLPLPTEGPADRARASHDAGYLAAKLPVEPARRIRRRLLLERLHSKYLDPNGRGAGGTLLTLEHLLGIVGGHDPAAVRLPLDGGARSPKRLEPAHVRLHIFVGRR